MGAPVNVLDSYSCLGLFAITTSFRGQLADPQPACSYLTLLFTSPAVMGSFKTSRVGADPAKDLDSYNSVSQGRQAIVSLVPLEITSKVRCYRLGGEIRKESCVISTYANIFT